MSFDIPALQKAANTPSVNNFDLARYILSRANVDWSKAANLKFAGQDSSGGSKSPSVLSRVLDIISRPSYAVDEMVHRFIEHEATTTDSKTGEQVPLNPQKHKQDFLHEVGDILHGGISGLAGTKKTNWAQIFNELNPNASPVAKYGGGFLLDIATDPLTYFGPGLARGAIKGGKALITGGKSLSEGIPESKGIISIDRGVSRVPVDTQQAQRLPAGLRKMSPQVRLPDISSPSMAIPPKFSVPKVNIPIAKFGLPTKVAENIQQFTPQEVETLSRAGTRKTAQILAQVYKDKGYNVNAREIEKTLASVGKDKFSSYIREAKDAPINREGLKAQEQAKALRIGNLKSKNPISLTNIEPAQNIVHKIADGDFHRLIKPASTVSPADPKLQFWANRTAQQFEQNVLNKSNKFAKTAGKAPSLNNPAQQANLFLRFATKIAPQLINAKNANTARFAAKRYTDAYRMMKVAENYFRSKGLHPTFWDGSKVALTDVIDELGGPAKMTQEHMTQVITAFKNRNPEKIINPEIRQAIENVRARDAVSSAKWVRLALDQNSRSAKVAEQVLSSGKYNDFVKKLISDNSKVMSIATDASPTSISSAQKLLREMLIRNGTPPQLATDAKKTYIQLYVSSNSKKLKWLPVQAAQTRAIGEVLDSNPAQLGRDIDKNNEASNWFLTRFATWYGQKDLRPAVLENTMTAINNAAARARIWNQVAKDYTSDEIKEAFKVAQGHIVSPSSQRVSDLGSQFQKSFENLFSSTGVSNEAQKAASVALRSGALIEDLNKQLKLVKSSFKFTQAKDVEDFLGNSHNYSKGADWLKSWEVSEISDPLDFIMRIETATEQLMHQYAYLDELSARWGSKVKSKIFSTPVDVHSRLQGLYFPKELALQIDRSLKTWNQIYDPKSDLIRFLDKITRAWKSGVTVYAPSHHIRNFIGDTYLSWLAGVNSPTPYNTAAKIIRSQKNRYKTLETINDLTHKNAIVRSLTRPGDKVLTTRGGVDLTAEQVYIAAHSRGLLSHVNVIEDLIGDPLIKTQPFNGRVRDFVHNASEVREHYVRLAHFVDSLKKSGEKNLPRLFSDAANQVRKWHPDGMDLTKFERERMKRIFPFYSWTRKIIPLMVEGAVTRPGKIIAYPRAMFALQGALGQNPPSVTDPFPEDQLFPNWIKAKGIGPILGSSGNYTIVNPSNPFNDLISQFLGTGHPRDIISGVGSSLNPIARVPAELLTGTTVLGQPVDQDLNRYATEQIPVASLLSRLFNIGITGPTNKAQKQGLTNNAAIINFLTALGIQPTGPYIKEAEFEKKKGLQ